MKKIGLYGGSFDPAHEGHLKLALQVLDKTDLDEIWFVLAYDQPFKEKHFETFENRLKILDLTIKNYPNLKVCTIEKDLEKPSYSYNTVIKLKELYPHYNFTWIIGADNLKNLDKWYRIEDFKKELDFIVVEREHSDLNTEYPVISFNHKGSSTAIRNGDLTYLSDDVIDIMFKNHIYIDTILYNVLSKKRADHVKRCVDVGLEIAEYYDVDKDDVYKAVVLHDISKELDKDLEMGIMKKYYPEHLHYHQKVYHQFTGAYIAKHNFRIHDENILKAIASHTTGDQRDLLSMITFIADKVERGRSYAVEDYISLAKKDINKAFDVIKADGAKAREKKKVI